MNKCSRIYRKLFGQQFKLERVFTPTSAATINYLQRVDIESQIKNAINLPGKQIILYGHSGSGKTTIYRKILEEKRINYVCTPCKKETIFNDLILEAFDQLNPYYVSDKTETKSLSNRIDAGKEYKHLKAAISSTLTDSESSTMRRMLPPQLNEHKLSELLGARNVLWVIEDFHKLDSDNKQKLADVLKIFVDISNDFPNVKIICVGAADTAHEIIQLDTNLISRVDEIHVPLLKDEEIKKIINNGCNILNIDMSSDLIDKIVYYSNRLASIAHQMCYVMCRSNDIIAESIWGTKTIGDDKFSVAVKDYISSNSDNFKNIYFKATKDSLGWYILKTFVSFGCEYISLDDVFDRVSTKSHLYPIDDIQCRLAEFSDTDNGPLYYKAEYEKYTMKSPFLKAFITMQLALEKSEKDRARKNRKKKSLLLYDQNDKNSIVYHELLEFIKENSMYLHKL